MTVKEYNKNPINEKLLAFETELQRRFPNYKRTSGYRPGAKTKSGNDSRHGKGEAIDFRYDPEIADFLWNTVEGVTLLNTHGAGFLDESTKEVMDKTGATGAHIHVGFDSTLVPKTQKRYEELVGNVNPQVTNLDSPQKTSNFTPLAPPLPVLPTKDDEKAAKQSEKENTTEEKNALLQRQKEHDFLQEIIGEVNIPKKQQQERQPEQELPQTDIMKQYAQVSQVVEAPAIMQQGGEVDYAKVRDSRVGKRVNADGTESTHLMTQSDNNAYPTLFQKEDGSWYELPNGEEGNWQAKKEAIKRNEFYTFSNEAEAIKFAKDGTWKKYQDGGQVPQGYHKMPDGTMMKGSEHIPTSKNGMYEYPNQKVVVPTDGSITMRGINHPILGISQETGEKKMMMPGIDSYFFKGTKNVLEIPMMQTGGTTEEEPEYDYVNYGTPEYEKAYNEGRFAERPNLLDEVVITAKRGANSAKEEEGSSVLPERGSIAAMNGIKPIDERLFNTRETDTPYAALSEKIDFGSPEVKSEEAKQGGKDAITEIQSTVPEVVITYSKEGERIKKAIAGKEDGLNPVEEAPIEMNLLGNREQIKEVQKKLKDYGYNLNPNGIFKDEGIDGLAGNVTKKAIEDYNRSLVKGYKSTKEGLRGFLGDCKEEQCSEYGQNELFDNYHPTVSREEWNKKTGLHGDAWDIGRNILNAGGKKIGKKEVSAGDVVTMYTGGRSAYQSRAQGAGVDVTHFGVVDQVNPDGSYYVLHNNHKISADGKGYEGQEFRTLVGVDQVMKADKDSKGGFIIVDRYRPNIKGLTKDTSKPLREDTKLTINEDYKDMLGDGELLKTRGSMAEDSIPELKEFNRTKRENLEVMLKPLNSQENKKKMSVIFDIDEEEYQSIAKLVVGVMAQESSFGTSLLAKVKEPVADLAKLSGKEGVLPGLRGKIIGMLPTLKSDETSRGDGRLKYDTNFHEDLNSFGINKQNFTADENMPITSFYKIATDYKRLLKSGESKEKAMYKAVVLYNASLKGKSDGKTREDWAEENDVDYANKVINYSNVVDVKDDKKSYKTTVDDLLVKGNTLKWAKTVEKRGS